MPIQTVGNIQDILKNYDAKKWTKSVQMESEQPLGMLDAQKIDEAFHSTKKPFAELLSDSIMEVNGLQKEANKAIERLATGKSKNIHETMLAVEKADIAFKTMNQIRSKVLDAYNQILRMQI